MNTSNIKTPTRGNTFFPRLRSVPVVDHGNHKYNKAYLVVWALSPPWYLEKGAERNRGI